MAKYSVTHSCGHTIEHQLYGKTSGFGGRDSKIEWLQEQPCLECKHKQDAEARDQQNRAAAEANRKMGALPLIGSEAQTLWAESIRHRALTLFQSAMQRIQSAPERKTEVEQVLHEIFSWLMDQPEAKWWIETIGTLKSKEGLAPLFGILDGKVPAASDAEVLRCIMLESPHLTEVVADTLHLGDAFRARLAGRVAAAAKTEMVRELELRKPVRPAFLQALVDKHGTNYHWNGKIYSGRRIFICNQEIKLTPEQEREILDYQKAQGEYLKAKETIG